MRNLRLSCLSFPLQWFCLSPLIQTWYGEGSTFTAYIPQEIRDKAPFASVTDPQAKKVLIYETREVYGNSIVCSTDNLGVSCKLVADSKGFAEALETDRFNFIFVKLDEVIARWIPATKQIKAGTGIKRKALSGTTGILIPGVDTQKGITMTGGTEAGYRKVLTQFYKDATERLPAFSVILDETAERTNNQFSEEKPDRKVAEQLSAFVIQVHALKSAAGTIGAAEVSKKAAALEAAGKAGNMELIRETLPLFREHLAKLVEGIGKVLEDKGGEMEAGSGEQEDLVVSLSTLRAALETKNMKEIDKLLEKIETVDDRMRETKNEVSDKVLMGEYTEAIESVNIIAAKER
jgi:HPt (histidine-containing phosphotransfer) domain-containing protein